uniref:Uncharacterized protein n=1 Tax=Phaeocystis antarctica TaxID=33657 RepID=A0A7S0HBH7_9EUKA|mmetsp:Transcript_1402/g.3134  ORF Transcript_1402/g.3134 Transcript_1402/m.3134 type:complete len:221 (+) Transcript_1402:218-880(+)
MLAAIAVQSFTPPTSMAGVSTRTTGVTMQAGSRRELLSQVGGAAFALAGVAQSASAKAGQFGKQDVFGIGISSPYVGEKVVSGGTAGTPYIDNVKSTYGFAPTGDILAAGYTKDVTRETAQFEKGCKLIANLQTNIDSKTWWKVRDQLRGTDVYSLRGSMLAINNVLPEAKKDAAAKAYKKVFAEMEALDLACKKKEQALATKENSDMLQAIAAYKLTIV